MARLYRLRRKFVGMFLNGRQCEGRDVIPGECFGAMTVHEAIRRSAMGEIVPGPKTDAQGQRFHALCAGHHNFDGDGTAGVTQTRHYPPYPYLKFFGISLAGMEDLATLLTSLSIKNALLVKARRRSTHEVSVHRLSSVHRYMKIVGITLTRKRRVIEEALLSHDAQVSRYKGWTTAELEVVRQHYGKTALREIGRMLDRNPDCVAWKARQLGLDARALNLWTTEEERYIRDHCRESLKALAALLPRRTEGAIKFHRLKMRAAGRFA